MANERHGFFGDLIIFFSGAAIGAGLALLFAPRSGRETRAQIKEMSSNLGHDLKENYEQIGQEAQRVIEQVRGKAEKTIESMKQMVDNCKEDPEAAKVKIKPKGAK